MFRIVGNAAKDLCDPQLKVTRRDIMRVGGSAMLGLSLGSMLKLKSANAAFPQPNVEGAGWNKAKSIIMVYLQGGQVILTYGILRKMFPTMSKAYSNQSRPKFPGSSSQKTCRDYLN